MAPLIDHIEITAKDMAIAVPFYDRLLPLLGFSLRHRSSVVIERHAITSPRAALAGEAITRRRPGALGSGL
jgi:hypothetical protein